jgi:hypothetical protein
VLYFFFFPTAVRSSRVGGKNNVRLSPFEDLYIGSYIDEEACFVWKNRLLSVRCAVLFFSFHCCSSRWKE